MWSVRVGIHKSSLQEDRGVHYTAMGDNLSRVKDVAYEGAVEKFSERDVSKTKILICTLIKKDDKIWQGYQEEMHWTGSEVIE